VSDVSVVVVTYNALPWLEQSLESVRGHETVVVDHESSDGTVELVQERFPGIKLVHEENRGLAHGWNTGVRETSGRYVLLLNADAWMDDGAVEALAAFADSHPDAAVIGPRLRYPDGRLQRSVRGFPTLWRLATEYFFLRKLAPRTDALNAFYGGGFAHDAPRRVESLYGAALLVRREAIVVEQENKGMGGGNNAGIRVATGRYVLLLNSDAWVVGGAIEKLGSFADAHPRAAVVGPRLTNPDGSLQRSVRGDPTLWRLATEYLFLRKLAPNTDALNAFYGGGFAHDAPRRVESLYGAALLVRREAIDEVGLFDEDFFMFSEETDWLHRFRKAGWEVWFTPDAEVVHLGGASHGGRLYVENLRGILRFMAKNRGPKEAERSRLLLLWSLRLRSLVFRGDRGRSYQDGAAFLASGTVSALLQ